MQCIKGAWAGQMARVSIHVLTLQTAQTEEFMFQNVAYRPTVYRTGEIC